MSSLIIKINALHVENTGNGEYEIIVPSRDLTKEESNLLDTLFPDLESAVGRLLAKQALFNAIK
jgi:hypothetical protein